MQFYFCEKCGKRLTEFDIEEGKARDKKLNGVYCSQCGEGVATAELMPVSPKVARKLMEEFQKTHVQQQSAPSYEPQDTDANPSHRKRSSPPSGAASATTSKDLSTKALVGFLSLAVVALMMVIYLMGRSGAPAVPSRLQETRADSTKDSTAQPPIELNKEKSDPPVANPPVVKSNPAHDEPRKERPKPEPQQGKLPMVRIRARNPNIPESGRERGTLKFTRSAPAIEALTVNYTLGGTAKNGVDYAVLPGTATFPPGEIDAYVYLTPIPDKSTEGIETVIITLAPHQSYRVEGEPAVFNIIEEE